MINPQLPKGDTLARSRRPIQRATSHCRVEDEAAIAAQFAALRRTESTGWGDDGLRRDVIQLFSDGQQRFFPDVCKYFGRHCETERNSLRAILKRLVSDGELSRAKVDGIVTWRTTHITTQARLKMAKREAGE